MIREHWVFLLLLGYAAGMPALVSMVGVWFLPHLIAPFEHAGAWAMLLFAVVTAVCLTLALMPSIVMAALAGALFGLPGLLPAIASYLLACIAAFEIVRRSARPVALAAVRRSSLGLAILEEFQQATLKIIVLGRISPGIPFALMNVVMGVSPVERSTYIWGTLLGMLPRTLIFVAVGSAARPGLAALKEGCISTTPEGILALALLALTAVGAIGLSWYAGKAIRRVCIKR